MKFPNWFKYLWWVLLIIILSYVICVRMPDILEGNTTSADFLILVLWFAIALTPLFQEINLPGVSLKHKIEEFRRDVTQELLKVRTTIASSVDVRTHVYPSPPPDTRLPELEERIRSAVDEALERYGIQSTDQEEPELERIGDNTQFLMSARYSLETQARRIWQERIGEEEGRRPMPFYRIVQDLVGADLLEPKLGHLLREVYSICSPAVHGEPVSDAKVNFVRDVIPELLSVLRAL